MHKTFRDTDFMYRITDADDSGDYGQGHLSDDPARDSLGWLLILAALAVACIGAWVALS